MILVSSHDDPAVWPFIARRPCSLTCPYGMVASQSISGSAASSSASGPIAGSRPPLRHIEQGERRRRLGRAREQRRLVRPHVPPVGRDPAARGRGLRAIPPGRRRRRTRRVVRCTPDPPTSPRPHRPSGSPPAPSASRCRCRRCSRSRAPRSSARGSRRARPGDRRSRGAAGSLRERTRRSLRSLRSLDPSPDRNAHRKRLSAPEIAGQPLHIPWIIVSVSVPKNPHTARFASGCGNHVVDGPRSAFDVVGGVDGVDVLAAPFRGR